MKEDEGISQRTYMRETWTWATTRILPEQGWGGEGWVEVGKGGKKVQV